MPSWIASIRPVSSCVKLGLATVVDTELLDWREKTTKSGMIWQIVSVKVTVTIIDSESDESTDNADDTVPCRKCGKNALFVKMSEFEDKQVKCYTCPACKTETRKEAS